MSTSNLLLLRLVAALLNVAPPIVGSYALGRETYGKAASVLAIAIIIMGPISQYLSQNLLRLMCVAADTAHALGAALLFMSCAWVMVLLAQFMGVFTAPEALQLCIVLSAQLVLRVCEVTLISTERVGLAIVVFFAVPPTLCSCLYVVASGYGGGADAAAMAQTVAYCGAALFGLSAARGAAPRLLEGLLSRKREALRELAASVPLMVSGGATVAVEFLPTVLLRAMDAFAVIPAFEIARKIASIPTTLVNPLMNQVNPRMIRAYATNDVLEIRSLQRRMMRFVAFSGTVFGLGVALTLLAGIYDPRAHEISTLLLPLSIGSVGAMLATPYQPVLIAARDDRWFAFSSGIAVVLMLTLTYLLSTRLGPGLAVASAFASSITIGGLIVINRARLRV